MDLPLTVNEGTCYPWRQDSSPLVGAVLLVVEVELNPVHDVLSLCGVTAPAAREIFMTVEGLDSVDAFATLSGDANVIEMAKRMASCTANAGHVILGMMQIKKIVQAFVFWVKDHHKRNLAVDPEMWTKEEEEATLEQKEAKHNFEKVDIDIIEPGKCQTKGGLANCLYE